MSLLNVDYKIASRDLAGRLLKVIHLVVNCDQSCGVPGRLTGDTVALLRDVVNNATSANVPVAILSLDQEKPFDRVDWGFLRSVAVHMGFGPSFVGWVDLFYSGVQSAVKVNGYLTHFFKLSRGIRQDCPLSLLLYVLYAEVLACSFRANPRIQGLLLPGASSPLSVVSQYAHDTSLVVTSTDAIKAVFDTFCVFASLTGSLLIQIKSKGLWLGSWCGFVDTPIRLDWASGTLKILEIFFGSGDVEEMNWRPSIVAVKNVINFWRQRGLSFRRKAFLVNALALSRIWYVTSLIHLPVWVLRELASIVFSFFWKGKPDLVARKVVCQPTSLGGFGVVSIELKAWAFLVQWIRRLVTKHASLVHFSYYYCWHLLRLFAFGCSFPPFFS